MNDPIRGRGRYAVWQGSEYDATPLGDEDGTVLLTHYGAEPPSEDFTLEPRDHTHAPLRAFEHAVGYSALTSLITVDTTAWWRGGRFVVWHVIASTAFIEFDNMCERSKDYAWFVGQPELEITLGDRLGGDVPVSELYDVEQTVRALPLETPDWVKRRGPAFRKPRD